MSLNKDGDLEGILARPNIDVNFWLVFYLSPIAMFIEKRL